MSKFHIGDVWADSYENHWLVVLATDDIVRAAQVSSAGGHQEHIGRILDRDAEGNWGDITNDLQTLVSSQRWIPFTEMLPEPPSEGDKRKLVVCDDSGMMMFTASKEERKRAHTEYGFGVSFNSNCTWSWRYLVPPETP